MLTLDTNSGMPRDIATIYKSTEEESDDGTDVVITMTIGDDEDFILEYTEGPHRARTQIFIPFSRLEKLIKEA